jgi:branched-chain amino acid transport system permease protein
MMGRNSNGSVTLIVFAVLLAIAMVAPYFVYPQFLMRGLCLALFACAFNLLLGYVGLLSFGHAAFFLSGALVAGILGFITGYIAIRRQGIYFAMVTLALAQMLYFFCLQVPFTHGEDGIQAIPRGYLFGVVDLNGSLTMYYFVLAVFLAGFFIIQRTIHSPFGQTIKAIRENEARAISLGYNADRYKLLAFVISATLAGVAGSLFALVFQIATLNNVHWHTSGEVVLMTLLGGMGTVLGPVVGAFFVASLQQYLAAYGAWVSIIQGVIFVVCVLLFRRGIVGEIIALMPRIKGERSVKDGLRGATAPHGAE